jgi:hypothetical protein
MFFFIFLFIVFSSPRSFTVAYNYPSLLALLFVDSLWSKILIHHAHSSPVCSPASSRLARCRSSPTTRLTSSRCPLCMTVVFLSGVAVSIMLGGVLGLAAIFPPRYITAVMIGQGVAGIVVMLLSIIARVGFPNDKAGKSDAAYLYFSLASAVILVCLVLFFVLLRLPITHHYHSQHSRRSVAPRATSSIRPTRLRPRGCAGGGERALGATSASGACSNASFATRSRCGPCFSSRWRSFRAS